ncbi:hypothetical protein PaG_02846 [Moesziomyces aphidis]|uniref:Yeast cell wall synthesis Kre9/Knh1-like N-terminal domain-containing protein n=1 Tax=Moesziomyces aphidis TaxID=84754 RepID=W3VQK8_MOEAP|nr:hypothetical protein PaG_02846 [Moesziomyces aphidis]
MVATKVATLAVLVLAAADAAVSTIVITKPVASTTGHGGKRLSVEWNDDGKSPSRRDWGRVNIYLATGSRDVQYKLQTLDTNVSYDQGQARYSIDANAGPNGGYYFLRFEGTNTSAAGGIPPMAFSARFTLDQMSGNFNSTIMSQVSGVSGTGQLTAAAATASATASSAPSFFSFTSTKSAAATSSTASAASAQATSIKSSSAAAPNANNKLAGFASALVGLAAVGAAFL